MKEMNANEMVQRMVAIAVAVVVFGMILLPIVQSAAEQGVSATGTNTADVKLGFDATTITIEYDTTAWKIDEAHADVTKIVTSDAYITFSSASVTLNGSAVDESAVDKIVISGSSIAASLSDTPVAGSSFTLDKIKNSSYVLTDAAETKTYGMWSTVTGLYINADVNDIVIGASSVTMEKYTADSTVITATLVGDEGDYTGAYEVSAITGTSLVAPLSFTYTEPLDGNMAALLEVIPILVVLGIMLACVYMFVSNRGN